MTSFAARLNEHEAGHKLKERWDDFVRTVQQEIRETGMHGHDRFEGVPSTRYRWLAGKPTRCAACVQALARVLDDDRLVAAWEAERKTDEERRRLKDVRTRIRGLSGKSKLELKDQLEADLASIASQRESLRIEIELAPFTPAVHRGTASLRWRGGVPPNAKVSVVSDRDSLNAAFADKHCIYRDLLHLSDDELAAGYEALAAEEPAVAAVELEVKPSAGSWTALAARELDVPGSYEFGNDAIENADVRLHVRFPYPAEYTCYPVEFGSYRVSGIADVSMRLAQDGAPRRPELFVYPSGRETRVTRRGDALSIELGESDALLPTGTAVFFYWTVGGAEHAPGETRR